MRGDVLEQVDAGLAAAQHGVDGADEALGAGQRVFGQAQPLDAGPGPEAHRRAEKRGRQRAQERLDAALLPGEHVDERILAGERLAQALLPARPARLGWGDGGGAALQNAHASNGITADAMANSAHLELLRSLAWN